MILKLGNNPQVTSCQKVWGNGMGQITEKILLYTSPKDDNLFSMRGTPYSQTGQEVYAVTRSGRPVYPSAVVCFLNLLPFTQWQEFNCRFPLFHLPLCFMHVVMVKFFIIVWVQGHEEPHSGLTTFPRDHEFRSGWKNGHDLGYFLLRRKNVSVLFGIVKY